jgi:hypothetical protein
MYFYTTNARERIAGFFNLADKVFLTAVCLTELQKILKLNIHSLASLEFCKDVENCGIFTVLPHIDIEREFVYQLMDIYASKKGKVSKKSRNRDLSFADGELLYIAKQYGLILHTADKYVCACGLKENVTVFNPIEDITQELRTLKEFDPYNGGEMFRYS